MPPKFSPILGAQGFQQSNPNVLSVVSLLGSLQLFEKAGMMPPLRKLSIQLTSHLEELLVNSKWYIASSEVRKLYGPAAELIVDSELLKMPNICMRGVLIHHYD